MKTKTLPSVHELDFDYYEDVLGDSDINDIIRIPPEELVKKSWINDELDTLWLDNYQKNKSDISVSPIKKERHKPIILIGASPAIKKNVNQLKKADERFTIICCNTSLKYILSQGVKPDYVFAVEGNHHIAKDFDCDTKDLTLIASPFISHEALMKWQGDKYFYMIGGGKKFDKRFRKDWEKTCDIDIGGGNVVSTSFLWAYKFLDARDFIVIGMSLCFYDEYYLDGRIKPNENIENWRGKYMALDINGQVVNTTPALTMYKTWFETYIRYAIDYGGGSFINSTEDGILGVLPKPIEQDGLKVRFERKFLPWMSVVPLEVAIEGHKNRMEDIKNGTRNRL